MSLLTDLLQMFASKSSQAGDRMMGQFLPPEQRSIMPGVNELNAIQTAGQNARAGKPFYHGPELIMNLMNALAGAGITTPVGRVYHGTPSSLAGRLPTSEMGKVFDPLVGSPGHYVITDPAAAGVYSEGSISGAGALTAKGDYGPNIRPYMMQQHQSLATNQPVTQAELDQLLQSLQSYAPAAKTTKGGSMITPETQRSNLINAIQNSVLPDVSPGEHLRGVMSNMVGQPTAEALLNQGGFKSITYPGEHPSTLGRTENAQAFKVLDNSILQNLFDALANKPGPQ